MEPTQVVHIRAVTDSILTGTPLAPSLPEYKKIFEKAISSSDYYSLSEGLTSLQQAIENKKVYRKDKTWVPAWLYRIFDALGWGAVGQAERELHRTISAIFDHVMKNQIAHEDIAMVLRPINSCYLKEHMEHPLFKKIASIEVIESILIQKGINKFDFKKLFTEANSAEGMLHLMKKLEGFLGENYNSFADLQSESATGVKINLLQLAIQLNKEVVAEWIVDVILPKCSDKVRKTILTQRSTTVASEVRDDVILQYANSKKLQHFSPVIEWNRNVDIHQIRANSPLLKKLVVQFNELSYPKTAKSPTDVIYCQGTRRKWPYPEDRDVFLKAMIND